MTDLEANAAVPDSVDDAALVAEAVALAGELLSVSLDTETRSEASKRQRLGRLLDDPGSMELTLAMTDEVMRIPQPTLAANRFARLIGRYGTGAFGPVDSLMLRAAAVVAPLVPRLVMPLVERRTKAETAGIILSANDPALANHISRRSAEGVRLNLNALGEAILSDAEAEQRLATVLEQIRRSDVNYVSVKLSSVVANLDIAAFEHSVDRVSHTLRLLYRTAEAASPPTFVSLDMEEYRDLELTVDAFTSVLNEDEFGAIDAGIVLQAYLPDSQGVAKQLCQWASQRHATSGGSIKIRLVKGANLAMEKVEAELHGWVPAPYGTKAEVDANYKAVLDILLAPEWAEAVRVGLASHNLFDVAWALVRSRALGCSDRIEFEMLEGMAPSQARALETELGAASDVLMYSPVVADSDYGSSLAYLSRRLDENTQADNFLRALFVLTPDSPEFNRQAAMFEKSVADRTNVFAGRRRQQLPQTAKFSNQPELDFTNPVTREQLRTAAEQLTVPAVTAISTVEEVEQVMRTAKAARQPVTPDSLRTMSAALRGVADLMAAETPETVALLAGDTQKTMRQSVPEIAEAIDFCRYYGGPAIQNLQRLSAAGFDVRGRGTTVVVSPWNFPYAIPTGGVAAALAAGNAVILKPAPQAIAAGARIVDQFHRAGVATDILQLVVCEDGPVGQALVSHPDVDTVTLTGSFETAQMFQGWRPELRVLAETSGKNALVITGSADLDLAIADLVDSAFGHSGQKCSAASLGIITADVYDNHDFLPRLTEAVLSVRTGPASDPATMMGPVIAPPDAKLARGLNQLDEGETWLVPPSKFGPSEQDWSPAVRAGVQPASWFHLTECFGPVLGLMRVENLDEAIEVQNGTNFGLTGGIHSLDADEIERWKAAVEVGNAYINRGITGAVVQRQPFGGWKKSAVGGSAKAGGPGYVQQFARIGNPANATVDYQAAWDTFFSKSHDPSQLAAESNVLRFLPLEAVIVRHDGGDIAGLELLRAASDVAGAELLESDARVESSAEFGFRLPGTDRVRMIMDPSVEDLTVCHDAGVAIDTSSPCADGFVELYRWVREQSVSTTLHRHGRIHTSSIASSHSSQ